MSPWKSRWSRVRLVKTATLNGQPWTRFRTRECDETSSTARRQPASTICRNRRLQVRGLGGGARRPRRAGRRSGTRRCPRAPASPRPRGAPRRSGRWWWSCRWSRSRRRARGSGRDRRARPPRARPAPPGRPSPGSRGRPGGAVSSEQTATAPFFRAASTNRLPSAARPRMATKSEPGAACRESWVTAVTSARRGRR